MRKAPIADNADGASMEIRQEGDDGDGTIEKEALLRLPQCGEKRQYFAR